MNAAVAQRRATISPPPYRPPDSEYSGILTIQLRQGGSTTPWFPRGGAVRRFSKPASKSQGECCAAYILRAKTEYAKAVVSIQRLAKNIDVEKVLGSSTEEDVARTALELFAQSTSLDKGRVSKLVSVLHHYHGVFDVLSQAEFSSLPLIWGGIKLILTVSFPLRMLFAHGRKFVLGLHAEILCDCGLDGEEPG